MSNPKIIQLRERSGRGAANDSSLYPVTILEAVLGLNGKNISDTIAAFDARLTNIIDNDLHNIPTNYYTKLDVDAALESLTNAIMEAVERKISEDTGGYKIVCLKNKAQYDASTADASTIYMIYKEDSSSGGGGGSDDHDDDHGDDSNIWVFGQSFPIIFGSNQEKWSFGDAFPIEFHS